MRISVDTAHDSHDDIKKVITMLQHFVGTQEVVTNDSSELAQSSSDVSEEASASFSSMFDSAPVQQEPTQESEELVSQSEDEQETQEEEYTQSSQTTQDLFDDLFSEKPKTNNDDKVQLY